MHNRDDLMKKFRQMRDAGEPIIGGGAGTGTAPVAVAVDEADTLGNLTAA